MKKKIGKAVLVSSVVLLASCGDPQAECRDGVTQMKSRLIGVVGSGEHKDINDPIVQAHTQLDIAQNQLATGNYPGCLESLEQARAMLNRSQRTNQQ